MDVLEDSSAITGGRGLKRFLLGFFTGAMVIRPPLLADAD